MDTLAGIAANSPLGELRRQRPDVVKHTAGQRRRDLRARG